MMKLSEFSIQYGTKQALHKNGSSSSIHCLRSSATIFHRHAPNGLRGIKSCYLVSSTKTYAYSLAQIMPNCQVFSSLQYLVIPTHNIHVRYDNAYAYLYPILEVYLSIQRNFLTPKVFTTRGNAIHFISKIQQRYSQYQYYPEFVCQQPIFD